MNYRNLKERRKNEDLNVHMELPERLEKLVVTHDYRHSDPCNSVLSSCKTHLSSLNPGSCYFFQCSENEKSQKKSRDIILTHVLKQLISYNF